MSTPKRCWRPRCRRSTGTPDRPGAPVLDQPDRRRDVREHAGLRRDVVAAADGVEQVQQIGGGVRRIGGRVDADHGVAAAQQQSVEHRRGDTARVVGRMVGLQPRGERAAAARSWCGRPRSPGWRRDGDQILVAHDLAGGRRHLGVRPGAIAAMRSALSSWEAVSSSQSRNPPDRQMRYRRKSLAVMAVDDQPGDLVGLVRDDLLVQEGVQRQVGEDPWAAARSASDSAAHPASWSPERSGVALAISSTSPSKAVGDTRNLLPVRHFSSLSASARIANSSSGELATRW